MTTSPAAPAAQNTDHGFAGTFKKLRYDKKRYGAFRGGGRVEVYEPGLRIMGRHVFPAQQRALIIVATIIGFFGLVYLATGRIGIPGIIILYVLVEYVFLKREVIDVPWDQVSSFVVDAKRKAVGIEFTSGGEGTSPAVLVSPRFEQLAAYLRAQIPGKEQASAIKGVVIPTWAGILIILALLIVPALIIFLMSR